MNFFLLTSLLLAVSSLLSTLCFSIRMQAFPPSEAGAEMIWWTVQMSRSFAFSSQWCQWCFLVYSNIFWYLFAALLCSACILCCRVSLSLYDSLPSLFVCLRSWVSSLVHQHFVFGEIFETGTELFTVSWMALVMLSHCMFRCLWLQMGIGVKAAVGLGYSV